MKRQLDIRRRVSRARQAIRDAASQAGLPQVIERVEPRYLLSGAYVLPADPLTPTSITAAQARAIKSGLDGVVTWIGDAQVTDRFAQSLDFLKDSAGNNVSVSGLLDPSSVVRTKLADAVRNYFDVADPSSPTSGELVTNLAAISGVTGVRAGLTTGVLGQELRVDITISTALTVLSSFIPDLTNTSAGLSIGTVNQPVTGTTNLGLTFGVVLDQGLADSEAFFTRNLALEGKLDLHSSGISQASAIGFLDASTTSASINTDLDLRLNTIDVETGNGIGVTLDELTGYDIASTALQSTLIDSITGNIPISATIGTYAGAGTVTLGGTSLGSVTASSNAGYNELKQFNNVDEFTVLSGFQQISGLFNQLSDSDVLGAPAPFIHGRTLGTAADLGFAVEQKLTSLLASAGAPAFVSAQSLATLIQTITGFSPALGYDAVANRATYTITLPRYTYANFTAPLDINLAAGALRDIDTDSLATVATRTDISFKVLLDVSNGLDAMSDRIRLQNAQAITRVNGSGSGMSGQVSYGFTRLNFSATSLSGPLDYTLTFSSAAGGQTLGALTDAISTNTLSKSLTTTGTPTLAMSTLTTVANPYSVAGSSIVATATNVLGSAGTAVASGSTMLTKLATIDMSTLTGAITRTTGSLVNKVNSAPASSLEMAGTEDSAAEVVSATRVSQAIANGIDLSVAAMEESLQRALTLTDAAEAITQGLAQAAYKTAGDFTDRVATVAADPVNFVINLGWAAKQGFNQFFSNLSTHLINGISSYATETIESIRTSGEQLELQGEASFDIDSKINLNSPDAPLLLDTSSITYEYFTDTQNLDERGSADGYGFSMSNGRVIAAQSTSAPNAANGNTIVITLPARPAGYTEADAAITNASFAKTGKLKFDFTMTSSSGGALPALTIDIGNLNNLATATVTSIPDFDTLVGGLTLQNDVSGLIGGLDDLFGGLSEALINQALSVQLPLVGDQFQKFADIYNDLRETFNSILSSAPNFSAGSIRTRLQNMLGVPVTLDQTATEVSYTVTVTDVLQHTGLALDTTLGLPALNATLSGEFDTNVSYTVPLTFGINLTDGAFLSTSTPVFSFDARASVSAALAGTMGFVVVSAESPGTEVALRFTVDVKDPGNNDNRLTQSEVASLLAGNLGGGNLANLISVTVDDTLPGAGGTIDFDVAIRAETTVDWLPGIAVDVDVSWPFGNNNVGGNRPSVKFVDARIKVGSFLTNTLGPVIETLNSILEPVYPVLEVLDTPLPILQDMGFEQSTLLDLLSAFSSVVDVGFIDAALQVLDFANFLRNLNMSDSLEVSLGDLDFDRSSVDLSQALPYGFDIDDLSGMADNINLNALSDFAALAGNEFNSYVSGGTSSSGELAFPIMENPLSAFELLLGLRDDVELVTYDLPDLNLEAGFSTKIRPFPLFPPFMIEILGGVGLRSDIKLGLDTKGVVDYLKTRREEDLFNGFYISDRENADGTGSDVNEFELFGEFKVYVGLDVGIAAAAAGGGLVATVGADLNDQNFDGKLRANELHCLNELFGFNGNVALEFDAYVRLLTEKYEYPFARIELFSFEIPPGDCDVGTPATGNLADVVNVGGVNTLTLNVGSRASLRDVQPNETNERVSVRFDSGTNLYYVEGFGRTESFSPLSFTRISADAGSGDDVIYIDPTVVGKSISLVGGSGNDSLYAEGATAAATISGGSGDDYISAGEAADTITGDDGNDTIHGNGGGDTITGGTGEDCLTGDAGSDSILGGNDNDVIYGGADNDSLGGGNGDDSVLGDDGNDSLEGGDGADVLIGGPELAATADNDTLKGYAGNDTLSGGDGIDSLLGGLDNDSLNGGDDGDFLNGEDGDDSMNAGLGDDSLLDTLGNNYFDGSDGVDTLTGGSGNDTFYGGLNNDTINAGLGNDQAFGQEGNDLINGSDGDDYLDGGANKDTIHGDANNDSILSGDGDDLAYGDGGNDTVDGNNGSDTIYGGDGDDSIRGLDGADNLYGEIGNDTIEGGGGNDVAYGADGNDSIKGNNNDDTLYGDNGLDTIEGNAGADLIYGGNAADSLRGGKGNDIIHAGLGNDIVRGQEDNDLLNGWDDDDSIAGNAGDDIVFSGRGYDTAVGGKGNDRVFGETGFDSLSGSEGVDYIEGGDGNDTLLGGDDNDCLLGQAGSDSILGDDGNDLLDAGGPETILDSRTNTLNGGAGNDSLLGADLGGAAELGDYLLGDAGDDQIHGLGGNDIIDAGDGKDTVYAGAGIDIVNGRTGDDRLLGEAGSDIIYGDEGDDYIDGGLDTDSLLGGNGDDRILAFTGQNETLLGGGGDDVITGSSDGADSILGGSGNDRIDGLAGNDTLLGEAGNDSLAGGDGDDCLEGGSGGDALLGGLNHDRIYGHSSSASGDDNATDTLWGDNGDDNTGLANAGRDSLNGNGGNDLLFGEGAGDALASGGGIDLFDYGNGLTTPDVYTTPPVTPNPAPSPGTPANRATAALNGGITSNARWSTLGGVDARNGINPLDGNDLVIREVGGYLVAAWSAAYNGNYEIYLAQWDGVAWQEVLAGSATGGGVTNSPLAQTQPSIREIQNSEVLLSYTETDAAGNQSIRVFTAFRLGASFTPLAAFTGSTNHAHSSQIVKLADGYQIFWLDNSTVQQKIKYSRFADGSGVLLADWYTGGSLEPIFSIDSYSVDSNGGWDIALAYSYGAAPLRRISFLFSNNANLLMAPSAISPVGVDASQPTVAVEGYSNQEFYTAWVAWTQQDENGSNIYGARLRKDSNNVTTLLDVQPQFYGDAAPRATSSGISDTIEFASRPLLAAETSSAFLWWQDDSVRSGNTLASLMFTTSGSGPEMIERLPSNASDDGITTTPGAFHGLTADTVGDDAIAWTETNTGHGSTRILRNAIGNTSAPSVVTVAADNPANLQTTLNTALAVGTIVIVEPGSYNGFTIPAARSGIVLRPRVAGSVIINGNVSISGINTVIEGLTINGGVTVGASGAYIAGNTISAGAVDGIDVTSGSTSLFIADNVITSDAKGIDLNVAATGEIIRNMVMGGTRGLDIQGAFTGDIEQNTFSGLTFGVRWNATARLFDNDIQDSGTGLQVLVGGALDGPGATGAARPNRIHNNVTGVNILNGAQVQRQWIYDNTTGAAGTGTLGGNTTSFANLIENNATGVSMNNGTVRSNVLSGNSIGVIAGANLFVRNNIVLDSVTADIRSNSATGVVIQSNTIDSAAARSIEVLSNMAADTRGNIVNNRAGVALYFGNNAALAASVSDYNTLHTDGPNIANIGATAVASLIGWQSVAAKDLHSAGPTANNRVWSRPHYDGGGQLLTPLAGDRSSSIGVLNGDPSLNGGNAMNQGAFALTSQDTTVTTPMILLDTQLDSFTLTSGQSIDIKWRTFNVTGGTINIDLYQATANGPVFVSTIVAGTANDGLHTYVPATTVSGAIIHLYKTSDAAIFARSLPDTSGPVLGYAALATKDSTPALTGTISDNTASIFVTVLGIEYAATNNGNGTWTLANNVLPVLADGTYDVELRSVDSAGNTSTMSFTGALTIDTTAPVIAFADLETTDTRPALSGTIDDSTASVTVRVNGTNYAATVVNGVWSIADNVISTLADGIYDVRVTATDAVTNISDVTFAGALVVDATSPQLTFTPITTNDSTPDLYLQLNDASATITLTINGNVYTPEHVAGTYYRVRGSSLAAPLADGSYTVTLQATDGLGNAATLNVPQGVIVDTTAPSAAVTVKSTNDRTPSLAGTVNDPTASITIQVNGIDYAATNNGNGTWTLADNLISSLPDGAYSVSVRATDPLTNSSAQVFANGLTVDGTAPTTTLNTFAFEWFQEVQINFSEALVGFVNGDAVIRNVDTNTVVPAAAYTFNGSATSGRWRFNSILANGNYRLTMAANSASDAFGNVFASAVTVDFFVLAGDATRDRIVNFEDLLRVAQNYGKANRSFSQGNFDLDPAGKVDFIDLLTFSQNYGRSVLRAPSPTGGSGNRRSAKMTADILG